MTCLVAGMLVLGPNGPVPIEMLEMGDEIVTVDEVAHRIGGAVTVRARVLALHRHTGGHPLYNVGGVRATSSHRWAVVRNDRPTFEGIEDLRGARVRTCALGETELRAAPPIADGGRAIVVFNVTTTARTYAVGGSPEGPYFVVHS